ncbi:ASCH domain-containing protein [Geminicoccus sp.]|uniref:ASCH domain-containing protein n=1 Tax=Geminicoccus sp. TaxID=2024832 RepID=UPI0039C8B59F
MLGGTKRATCSSLAWCQANIMPTVGEISVVIDGRGRPACAIVTTSVEVKRFGEVDAAFALKEGEGDRSLEWWRAAHEAYFRRMGCFAPEMLVVCECFEVLEVL